MLTVLCALSVILIILGGVDGELAAGRVTLAELHDRTLSSSAGSTASAVASLAMISSPG